MIWNHTTAPLAHLFIYPFYSTHWLGWAIISSQDNAPGRVEDYAEVGIVEKGGAFYIPTISLSSG